MWEDAWAIGPISIACVGWVDFLKSKIYFEMYSRVWGGTLLALKSIYALNTESNICSYSSYIWCAEHYHLRSDKHFSGPIQLCFHTDVDKFVGILTAHWNNVSVLSKSDQIESNCLVHFHAFIAVCDGSIIRNRVKLQKKYIYVYEQKRSIINLRG